MNPSHCDWQAFGPAPTCRFPDVCAICDEFQEVKPMDTSRGRVTRVFGGFGKVCGIGAGSRCVCADHVRNVRLSWSRKW